jgi:hypothetical protein
MTDPKGPRSAYRYAVERLKWKDRKEGTESLRWSGCRNGGARFAFRCDADRFLETYAEGVTRAVHEGCVPQTFALRIVELPRGASPKTVLYVRSLWRKPKSADDTNMRVTDAHDRANQGQGGNDQ